jgi:hypothetical protein
VGDNALLLGEGRERNFDAKEGVFFGTNALGCARAGVVRILNERRCGDV